MSMQGWVIRAADLGIITPAVAAKLYRLFRAKGWHLTEPGDPLPAEEPERLKLLVLRALAEDLITESRAAELLGVKRTTVYSKMRSMGIKPARMSILKKANLIS
jgi:DNA-binding NtrC family response regulator